MHKSVLLHEAVSLLELRPGQICVDGTVGGGGHAKAILESILPGGFLLGIDLDLEALERVGKTLAGFDGGYELVHGNFADMKAILESRGRMNADRIILDLGVSSEQLDTPERGFSFRDDGPLDMRMDATNGMSAADVVNNYELGELSRIISEFGEERYAARIAAEIVKERKKNRIESTFQLASIVERAVGGRKGKLHPATRTFQALRIEVNRELENLKKGLEEGLSLLSYGGRMAVISFHSLEDRIVKNFIRDHAGRMESLQQGGSVWRGVHPKARMVTKGCVTPNEHELRDNQRSRSAKLRVFEKAPLEEVK